jgi:hypothetical protein
MLNNLLITNKVRLSDIVKNIKEKSLLDEDIIVTNLKNIFKILFNSR